MCGQKSKTSKQKRARRGSFRESAVISRFSRDFNRSVYEANGLTEFPITDNYKTSQIESQNKINLNTYEKALRFIPANFSPDLNAFHSLFISTAAMWNAE